MIIKEWKVLYTLIIIPDWYFFLPFILLHAFTFEPFLHVVVVIAALELRVHKLGGVTLFLGPPTFCRHQSASEGPGVCPPREGFCSSSLLFLSCALHPAGMSEWLPKRMKLYSSDLSLHISLL